MLMEVLNRQVAFAGFLRSAICITNCITTRPETPFRGCEQTTRATASRDLVWAAGWRFHASGLLDDLRSGWRLQPGPTDEPAMATAPRPASASIRASGRRHYRRATPPHHQPGHDLQRPMRCAVSRRALGLTSTGVGSVPSLPPGERAFRRHALTRIRQGAATVIRPISTDNLDP